MPGARHECRKSHEHAASHLVERLHHAGTLQIGGETFATDGIDEIPADLDDRKGSQQNGKLWQLGEARGNELGEKKRPQTEGL